MMDIHYDETENKITYSFDITHAFANETKELKLLLSLIEPDINKDDLDDCYKDIEDIIIQSYQNEHTDIEDLDDLIVLLDNFIIKMFRTKENIDKYYELVLLRKKVKKFAHKKFREGYDWIYKKNIEEGTIKSKIKYPDEKPRDFFNVDECEFQYINLVEHTWIPNTEKIKDIIKCVDL